ncbi:hypothetical protein AGLY_008709 [Aphis glycines]|uniref:Uncharacterized protein n=1 Tax=Aphis glycines TaxID=307491 RepID=A0A6G0TJD4_APHGL|nr:hypothetical protein AGLY_008709 [Aphis glycines]
MMSDLGVTLKDIFTEEGKLKPKNEQSATVDASTDTLLTPSWWDSDSTTEESAASKRRKARTVAGIGVLSAATNGSEESAMETEAENWTTVVKKQTKQKASTLTEPRSTAPKPKGQSKKPPAILVKPLEGQSYVDTVRTIHSCGLSRADIGANVKMRKTRDGCVLLELPTSANSGTATRTITAAIGNKLGDTVGKVLQLEVGSQRRRRNT